MTTTEQLPDGSGDTMTLDEAGVKALVGDWTLDFPTHPHQGGAHLRCAAHAFPGRQERPCNEAGRRPPPGRGVEHTTEP